MINWIKFIALLISWSVCAEPNENYVPDGELFRPIKRQKLNDIPSPTTVEDRETIIFRAANFLLTEWEKTQYGLDVLFPGYPNFKSLTETELLAYCNLFPIKSSLPKDLSELINHGIVNGNPLMQFILGHRLLRTEENKITPNRDNTKRACNLLKTASEKKFPPAMYFYYKEFRYHSVSGRAIDQKSLLEEAADQSYALALGDHESVFNPDHTSPETIVQLIKAVKMGHCGAACKIYDQWDTDPSVFEGLSITESDVQSWLATAADRGFVWAVKKRSDSLLSGLLSEDESEEETNISKSLEYLQRLNVLDVCDNFALKEVIGKYFIQNPNANFDKSDAWTYSQYDKFKEKVRIVLGGPLLGMLMDVNSGEMVFPVDFARHKGIEQLLRNVLAPTLAVDKFDLYRKIPGFLIDCVHLKPLDDDIDSRVLYEYTFGEHSYLMTHNPSIYFAQELEEEFQEDLKGPIFRNSITIIKYLYNKLFDDYERMLDLISKPRKRIKHPDYISLEGARETYQKSQQQFESSSSPDLFLLSESEDFDIDNPKFSQQLSDLAQSFRYQAEVLILKDKAYLPDLEAVQVMHTHFKNALEQVFYLEYSLAQEFFWFVSQTVGDRNKLFMETYPFMKHVRPVQIFVMPDCGL